MLRLPEKVRSSLRASVCIPNYVQAVHELVANSLDANATRVVVEIDPARLRLTVKDNGVGISSADLKLLGLPNCTSKSHVDSLQFRNSLGYDDHQLEASCGSSECSRNRNCEKTPSCSTSDNNRVSASYGLRGEALSSLGRIAFMEIRTKSRDSANTFCKIIRGGKQIYLGLADDAIPAICGTCVTLIDMFYCFPVRKKQVMNESGWRTRVIDRVRRLLEAFALSCPHVMISLVHTSSQLSSSVFSFRPVRSTRCAFEQIYGKAFLLKDLPPATWGLGNKVEGLFCPAHIAHSNKELQFFFLNGRHVTVPLKLDRLVNKVYEDARQALKVDLCSRHPVFLLSLSCQTRDFDMLLEPTKLKVCFKDISSILNTIDQVLRKGLGIWENPTEFESIETLNYTTKPKTVCDYFSSKKRPRPGLMFEAGAKMSKKAKRNKWKYHGRNDMGSMCSTVVKQDLRITKEMLQRCKFFAQVDRKFILARVGNQMLCFDQHAVDERIRLESFETQIKECPFDCGILDIHVPDKPFVLRLTRHEHFSLESRHASLTKWGFSWEVSQFSTNSAEIVVHISKIPSVFGIPLKVSDFSELLSEEFFNFRVIPQCIRKGLMSRACRGAIMFGDVLTEKECDQMLRDLTKCDFPFQCAHGRPSVVPLALFR